MAEPGVSASVRVPEAFAKYRLSADTESTFGPCQATPGRPTVSPEEARAACLSRPVQWQEVRSDGHRRAWSVAAG
jgi:hypothetical protein